MGSRKRRSNVVRSNVILGDPKRLSSAKTAATSTAQDAPGNLKGLLKVAGKEDDKFEGMKVL